VLGKVTAEMTEAARREAIQAESSAIAAEVIKGTHYNARVQPFMAETSISSLFMRFTLT
jgi:hypothetical protein